MSRFDYVRVCGRNTLESIWSGSPLTPRSSIVNMQDTWWLYVFTKPEIHYLTNRAKSFHYFGIFYLLQKRRITICQGKYRRYWVIWPRMVVCILNTTRKYNAGNWLKQKGWFGAGESESFSCKNASRTGKGSSFWFKTKWEKWV